MTTKREHIEEQRAHKALAQSKTQCGSHRKDIIRTVWKGST